MSNSKVVSNFLASHRVLTGISAVVSILMWWCTVSISLDGAFSTVSLLIASLIATAVTCFIIYHNVPNGKPLAAMTYIIVAIPVFTICLYFAAYIQVQAVGYQEIYKSHTEMLLSCFFFSLAQNMFPGLVTIGLALARDKKI